MNYLKIVLRHFLRKKLLTLINITGLGVGLAGVLLLALYLQDEWSIDRQHPDAAAKYRIETTVTAGTEVLQIDASLPLVAPLLETNFPEIVATTRFMVSRTYVNAEGAESGFYEDEFVFADSNIGEFFTFEWLQGDARTALATPDSVVVTAELARKYFADAEPLGQTLVLDGNRSLRVTGVIADPALRSHIKADAIATLDVLRNLRGAAALESWFALGMATYLQLAPSADMPTLWPAMRDLLAENMPPAARQIFAPRYQHLPEVHLGTRSNPATQRTRFDDAFVLFSISLAILVVACINFVNLSTARSTERQKEIAIRKVAGSGRWQIFLQHMGESVGMVMLALLLAMGIAELSLPLINAYTGKQLSLFANGLWLFGLLPGLVVALVAGFYPALYLSRFRPMAVLRRKELENGGILAFRNLLVIFQFSIAIVAIVASTVMLRQLQFAKEREQGFDSANVFVLENRAGDQWENLKQLVATRAGVEQVSAGMSRPFMSIASSSRVRYEGGAPEGLNLSQFLVDFAYFELFDVELLAGRLFTPDFRSDRQQYPSEDNPHPELSVILNDAMVQRLGWTPETALGKRFEMNAGPGEDFTQSFMGTVIGVVANMYVDSVQREIVPLFYYVPGSTDSFSYLFFKLDAVDQAAQIDRIGAAWRELYPATPMNGYLLDSKFTQMYEREERQLALLGAFAFLAVFISCIGLIGLATYSTEQRIKEVGIRKTIGASVWQIVVLFSADFSKLVLISNLIAWPIAYVAMSRWLENFAYRIDLTPLIFVGSGLIALCIAWVTVGGTAARAASAKPVLALRYE